MRNAAMPSLLLPNTRDGSPGFSAIIPRSAALFAILFQFRLLAGDLADTHYFVINMAFAFLAPWLLEKALRLSSLKTLLVLIFVPWTSRFFISLPRLFSGPVSVILDTLLLGLDRNNFVTLLPYYWAVLTNCFAYRSRVFLRADIIAQNVLLLVMFSIVKTADIEIYRLPVFLIAVFGTILFLQILAFIFTADPAYFLCLKERFFGAAAMFVIVILGGLLLIRPLEEQAVNKGGGLLQPKLFQFDFSQLLRLESEISLNDDLVLIVRKDQGDDHALLRRYVLSGYDAGRGFYLDQERDEKTHPARLPEYKRSLPHEEIAVSSFVDQEYYLVNFDASSFIALNQPVEVTPFRTWDVSSFNSAYSVRSLASSALFYELIDASLPLPDSVNEKSDPALLAAMLGLSAEDYAHYTKYGQDERIARYARELTGSADNYWDKIAAIYEELKYGDYRYSLKPGIAPDGDQLGHFLFNVKKGYCSYFAFSMTLLLRSLGIPARVAVGFFVDQELNTFDYYPVRSDMAHAWVEVRFPGYGWIEFDPTTLEFAEGEEFRFTSGINQEQFERLMREILKNRSRLLPKEKDEDEISVAALINEARVFFGKNWPVFLVVLLTVTGLFLRLGHYLAFAAARSSRQKTAYLWLHTIMRLRLAGYKRGGDTASSWARRLDSGFKIYGLYLKAAAARFSPQYGQNELRECLAAYGEFNRCYRRQASFLRRALAWIFPLAALLLPSGKNDGGGGTSRAMGVVLSLFIGLFVWDAIRAQEGGDAPDGLYKEALSAKNAENWEKALELLIRGGELYPDDFRFPWTLGSLYTSRGLHGLAWDEYKKAEKLDDQDTELLYQLSRTAGHLNRNDVSANYIEKLLVHEPDDYHAISDLAWMYFKLHRLAEGEALLLDAIERFGPDIGFSMTLGTIYSDMFRYSESKERYLEAINASRNPIFTAVAYYNLSILESRFYQYSNAFDMTNASLAAYDRSSGRLARGELLLRRLDFSQVMGEYQQAYAHDNSPLSKVSLAHVYLITGRLEEARLYGEDALAARDLSWMINYGITPDRYKRDIYEILHNTYRGLALTEKRLPRETLREWAMGILKMLGYSFKAEVNKLFYHKYSLIAAEAYASQGQKLDALSNYYAAFKIYPRRALGYLHAAREFETAIIPESIADYDLEEAGLFKDPHGADAALEKFDPVWEKDLVAQAYSIIARNGKGLMARDAAERLFVLNRGALRRQGISLPAAVRINGGGLPGGFEKRLRRELAKAGLDPRKTGEECRYQLNLDIKDGGFSWELFDISRGSGVVRNNITAFDYSSRHIKALARNIGDTLFQAVPAKN